MNKDEYLSKSNHKTIKFEHEKLREQIKSAICWIKNYKSYLFMMMTSNKIRINCEIPLFIYELSVNLMSKKNDNHDCETNGANFFILERSNNTSKIVAKRFKNIGNYYCDGKKYYITPNDILPFDIEDCELDKNIIDTKIAKLDAFIYFFNEVVKMSNIYSQ